MRIAARRDANEKEIIDALEREGCLVHRVNDANGFPDLVVKSPFGFYALEVKAPKGKLKPSQERFMAKWHGCVGIDVFVVRNVNEALISCGFTL